MKILITGASGFIGGEALTQCLNHPKVSNVVAFVRRDLPAELQDNPKLECVVIKDFAEWPIDVLEQHADAEGMIWAMGSYPGDGPADLKYPLAFVESMIKVLAAKPTRTHPFRCVHLSGKFVRQDQDQKLWFMEGPRKLKGRLETRTLACAADNPSLWATYLVRPGGVAPKTWLGGGAMGVLNGMAGLVLGKDWTVRVDELGAFMGYLAISGEGEEAVIENERIARRGRELLTA